MTRMYFFLALLVTHKRHMGWTLLPCMNQLTSLDVQWPKNINQTLNSFVRNVSLLLYTLICPIIASIYQPFTSTLILSRQLNSNFFFLTQNKIRLIKTILLRRPLSIRRYKLFMNLKKKLFHFSSLQHSINNEMILDIKDELNSFIDIKIRWRYLFFIFHLSYILVGVCTVRMYA